MLQRRGIEARWRLAKSRTQKYGKKKTYKVPKPTPIPLAQWTVLITINPNNEKIDINTFRLKIDKTMNWKMFDTVHWVFEQRGEHADELGKGFHMHAVATLTGDYQTKDVNRDLKRSFCGGKHPICGNKKHIDVKTLKYQTDYDNALEYIKGNKKDSRKEDKLLMDTEWREIHGIQKIYLKE
jgi:hypothetical protein